MAIIAMDEQEQATAFSTTLPAQTEAPESAESGESAYQSVIGTETAGASEENAYQSVLDGEAAASARPERIVDYCVDPEQAITIYRLVGALGVCAAVILVLAGTLTMVCLRKPNMLVVDRTSGGDRVVMMDDREFGLTDNVEFTKDRLTAGGKIYLVRNYLELLYGNNPDYREKQLEAAIKLMVDGNGRKFFRYLSEKRILEQQAAESWQASWSPQSITVDPKDSFTVRAIGVQKLRRIVHGTPVDETNQLNVTVRISRDSLGRDDRNLHTGYQIDMFDWTVLKNPTAPTDENQTSQASTAAMTSALQPANN
ncbi:MAG: hypothetical protein MSG64_19495 [Pyrinomonadaceae bacterium MAG19_C2-C3]|nr:hypothetical protein [Pyrinomonadaceae bacterium MAG19_C2-C3]